MYKTLYPSRDATLYSKYPEKNTGVDQILEIVKIASGSAVDSQVGHDEYYTTNINSRFLIDFDLSDVSASIASGDISNARFYLTIKATEAINIPIEYTIYAFPVSGSWTNGTGYYNNNPAIKDGVSWKYRNGESTGLQWSELGGDFYSASAYQASQDFDYEYPDIRMEVTNIVNAWISGSLTQHGFMLKHSDALEDDATDVGSLKFFAKDTHTIYIPRLEIFWDDVDLSGTGSVSQISGEDYVIYVKNLRESYYENETPKIRLGIRDRFPTRTYATSSAYTQDNRLPTSSYFQVMDSVTDEVIVPFDTTGTKISCDSSGNYFRLDMNSFLAERFYKVIFKVETDGGDTVNYIDDNYFFKVRRK